MGGFCSCFHVPEQDDAASTPNNCFCPGCLLNKFKNNHLNIIMRRQRYNITSSNHEAVGSIASDTCHSQVQPEPVEQHESSSCPEADEEECPTCLEEYTPENPKILARCSHHYHLSCIYEWKERSEDCPVCDQLMQFNESS